MNVYLNALKMHRQPRKLGLKEWHLIWMHFMRHILIQGSPKSYRILEPHLMPQLILVNSKLVLGKK
jgi:hypothetical protein